MIPFFLRLSRANLLLLSAALTLIVALIDWRVELNASFGFLYFLPLLIAASCLQRWQLALLAILFASLAEYFDPFPWEASAGIPRDAFMLVAYFGVGLFAQESARNRELMAERIHAVENMALLRRDAEQELRALVESSPAAILTVDSPGTILMANRAAHRVLGFSSETLQGEFIKDFLPPLARIPSADDTGPSFRTAMRCNGRRRDGNVFLADIWFSAYKTSAGPRLVAMFVDSSEEFRDTEEATFRNILVASRLAGGALSHEIRNGCGAISVVYKSLSRNSNFAHNEEFRALGHLVEGLEQIAALELQQIAGHDDLASVNLFSVLEELRIVAELPLRESGAQFTCHLPKVLPRVLADRYKLLQVLLNLAKNSQRAMLDRTRKVLNVEASVEGGRVVVRIRDTGHGIAHPERLFKPFQQGAEDTGLGLYLSRALMRTFKGDLRYEPRPDGCCFAVELMPFANVEDEKDAVESNE